jgi:3-hydroxyacyl-[acyl-carrier-protein] dehydratase
MLTIAPRFGNAGGNQSRRRLRVSTAPASSIMVVLAGACQGRRLRLRKRRDGMIYDITEIQKYLPHRYPFLMIDGVLEMERLKKIVAVKNVTINEAHFQGHFPGRPVMPGVLIIEGMAQAGGLLLLHEIPDRENKLLFLAAVDGVRFRRPVLPGHQLKIEVTVLSWRGDFCKIEGKGTVDGQLAAEATLMCKMIDRESAPKDSGK